MSIKEIVKQLIESVVRGQELEARIRRNP